MTRDDRISRRDLLKGTAVGVGGLGSIGAVSDATVQMARDGLVIPVGRGIDAGEAVDPDSSASPIQDAIDIVSEAGGGAVLLPAQSVDEDGPIYMKDDTSIVGWGRHVSEIDITNRATAGIVFDPQNNDGNGNVARTRLDGLCLSGPGDDVSTGPAIVHRGNTINLSVGAINIEGWHDSAYKVDEGALPFQCHHDSIQIWNVDAGETTQDTGTQFSGGAVFQWDCYNPAPANTFTNVAVYPTDTSSSSTSRVLHMQGGWMSIQNLNIGGTTGEIATLGRGAYCDLGWINYEPRGQPSTPSHLVRSAGYWGYHRVSHVRVTTGTTDYVYEATRDRWHDTDGGRSYFGMVREASGSGGTVNDGVLEVTGQLAEPVLFEGTSDSVANTTGRSLTRPVSCLGDLTTVG